MKVLYNDGHVGEINDAAEELEVIRHDAAMTLILEIPRLTRTISQLSKLR